MNYVRMKKYFVCKKDLLWYGIATIIFGFFFTPIMMAFIPQYMLISLIGSLIEIAGIVLIGIYFGQKGKAADYNEAVDELTLNFEKRAKDEFDLEDKILPRVPTAYYKGYEFANPDIIYVKRGGDEVIRSNGYGAAFVCAGSDKFYVYRKFVNFIEDKPQTIIKSYEYSEIGRLSFEPELNKTFNMKRKKVNIKYNLVTLTDSKGEIIFSMCTHEDVETVPTIEKINAQIEKMKSEKA